MRHQRNRLSFFGLLKALGVVALVLCAVVVSLISLVVFFPKQTINIVGAPFGVSVESVDFSPPSQIQVSNLQVRNFLKVGYANVQWENLSEKKFENIEIRDFYLDVSRIPKGGGSSEVSKLNSVQNFKPPFTIRNFDLQRAEIILSEQQKLKIRNLHYQDADVVQLQAEYVNLNEAVSIQQIRGQWSWDGLAKKKIDSMRVFGVMVDVDSLTKLSSSEKKESAPEDQKKNAFPLPPVMVQNLLLENVEIILSPKQKAFFEKMEMQGSLDDISKMLIQNVTVGDFGKVETIKLEWTWERLAQREIRYMDVTNANISLDRLLEAFPPEEENKTDLPQMGFNLKELRIRQSQITMNLFGPRMPAFVLPVAQVSPDLVFRDLYLGGSKSDPAAQIPVETVITNYTLTSPYDGISPMLYFGRIRVVFSWAGIQERKIDQLQISDPVIYIGNDLFWFTDDVKKAREQEEPQAEEEKPWQIGLFSVSSGQIEITAYGRDSVRLPFRFDVEPHHKLVVGDLTKLQLKTQFQIPPTTIEYPDYGFLRFENLRGKMEFSLPLGSDKANNIVNTLKIDEIKWKKISAKNGQLWITYDSKGIYGGFYAQAYGGAVGGEITFYWDDALSWVGSCYTKNINIKSVTELLYPQNFLMSGPVDSRFVVKGEAKKIENLTGNIQLDKAGKMFIPAVDDLMAKIPEDWTPFKKEIARTSLQAFRDYDYYNGTCEFSYAPPKSFLKLDLNGIQGKRNFDITWNDNTVKGEILQP